MKRFGILGGGIAGLSLSYFLGDESEILEKDDKCGGLCRSFHKEGFTYDLGGHIIFSKDQAVLDLELKMLGDKAAKFKRRNSIWYKNRFVKWPFENGLAVLEKEEILDCLYHFIENPQRPQRNFEDWIYNTFGKGLAERYLIPYNTKIWNTPPSEMGTAWVERIPKPPLEDILKSALGIETEGYTHQLYFYYPIKGGFEQLPLSFEAQVESRITRNFTVKAVRRTKKGWCVSNGSTEREYERLIVAMPIFDFLRALKDVPPDVMQAVDGLRYNSLIVVMVGAQQSLIEDQFAIYFPQEDLPFHRVCFYSYFGSNYVPDGASSVVAEITVKEGDDISSLSDEVIGRRVVDGLAREGFIEKRNVFVTDVQRTKYAYVIYDLRRERNLAVIYDYCQQQGIELCGRFAEFVYMNSDAVIRSAKNVADRLIHS